MAEERAPDLSEAQEGMGEFVGQRWANWRDLTETQEVLGWIRNMIGTTQDRWLTGHFGTWETNLVAQGGANALAQMVFALENIKAAPEMAKKEPKNDE